MIDIKGLDKADVLRVLYNRAQTQGMGFLQYVPGDLAKEKAAEIVKAGHTSFDYLAGRVLKVNIAGDTLDEWAYDRDNGQGAAAAAIATLRA